jgi:hypothetical protein
MSKRISRGHGGSRKIGRNKVKCEQYRREHRREKNKLRRLLKLYKHHPNDKQMANTIKRLSL